MKLFTLVCGLSLAVSSLVGCAASAGDETENAADSTADLSEGSGSSTAVDPSATKPVVWACNFQDGRSAVFVQSRVHSPFGTFSLYETAQNPNADATALAAGSGAKSLSATEVKFGPGDKNLVVFTETTEDKSVALTVDQSAKLKIGTRTYGWTARLPGEQVEDAADNLGGCWGVR